MNVQKQHSISEWKCVSGFGKHYRMPPFSTVRVPAPNLEPLCSFPQMSHHRHQHHFGGKGVRVCSELHFQVKSRYSTALQNHETVRIKPTELMLHKLIRNSIISLDIQNMKKQ